MLRRLETVQQFFERMMGTLCTQTTTMQEYGCLSPEKTEVFWEHLVPLLFVCSLFFGGFPVLMILSGDSTFAQMGVFGILINVFVLAPYCGVMVWIAGKIMPIFAREAGAGDIRENDAYALAVLAGTPLIYGTYANIVGWPGEDFVFYLMLCLSIRAYWIGGRVITGMSGANRVRVVGMVFVSLFVVSAVSTLIFRFVWFIAHVLGTGAGI